MSTQTIISLIVAGLAILGAIGSVLLLAFRVGTVSGTITSFMAASERDREGLRADLTRLTDRFSMHVEHHGSQGA